MNLTRHQTVERDDAETVEVGDRRAAVLGEEQLADVSAGVVMVTTSQHVLDVTRSSWLPTLKT